MFATLTINPHFEMLGINPLQFMSELGCSLDSAVIIEGCIESPDGAKIADNAALTRLYSFTDQVAGIANSLTHQPVPPQFDLTHYGVIPRKFAELLILLISQKLNEQSGVLVKFQECADHFQEVMVIHSPDEVRVADMNLYGFKETIDLIEAA